MTKIDEFKSFVKTKPWLTTYVNSGDMTWQKFYDMWSLYGHDGEVWDKYTKKEDNSTVAKGALTAASFGEIVNMFKNVDMESIRNGINGVQKAIGLFQDMTSKDRTSSTTDQREPYSPRPMFRRFED